jgi:hypothetical protein
MSSRHERNPWHDAKSAVRKSRRASSPAAIQAHASTAISAASGPTHKPLTNIEGWTHQRLALFFVFTGDRGAGAFAVGAWRPLTNSPSVNPSVTSGVSLRSRLWRWSCSPASRFFLFHPQAFPFHRPVSPSRASNVGLRVQWSRVGWSDQSNPSSVRPDPKVKHRAIWHLGATR